MQQLELPNASVTATVHFESPNNLDTIGPFAVVSDHSAQNIADQVDTAASAPDFLYSDSVIDHNGLDFWQFPSVSMGLSVEKDVLSFSCAWDYGRPEESLMEVLLDEVELCGRV